MITTLSIGIAVLGGLLVLMLATQLLQNSRSRKLAKHRRKDAAFADLLNYAAVCAPGVIVGKNGSFMAAYAYAGEDNASATEEHRNLVAVRINQALARMGNGWMIHVDAVRREAPGYSEPSRSFFPDPVTLAIDEERRRLFKQMDTMYEGYFVITFTFFPPALAQRKFVELMFDDEQATPDKLAITKALLSTFERDIANIESRLSSAVKLERLQGHQFTAEDGRVTTQEDFLRWLQFCCTGRNHPVQLPSVPMYLDSLVGGQEMWTGVVPKIGRKFVQVVALDGFPMDSYPGILSALAELQSEYRWSSRFIFMDLHEAIKDLEKYRKKWKQKVRGFFDQLFNTNGGAINQDALAMVQDAEAALAEVNSGTVAQGYYTSVVVLMDEDRGRLSKSAMQIEKAINALGFTARVETINTVDAFLGSLPGHGVENVRRPLLNTLNLAHLIPSSTIWTGENTAPCPMYPPGAPPLMQTVTHGGTPFRFNLHVRDVGHSFIFGPTGAGKSTLLGLTAAQLRRYPNMQIFAFDKGQSLYPLAAAIRAGTDGKSGLHFNVAADDDQLNFAPLRFLETRGDRAWAMVWLDSMLALNGLDTSPRQRTEIARALLQMHKDGTGSISGLVGLVQDHKIREALEVYTADGAMGMLLDAEEDGLSLSNFTVFEIEELMNMGEKYALPVLLYLFRRIERSLNGQPAALILDEAWLMLGHKVFREKIREWLKTLRKANCAVILATQSLTDAADSGILDVIAESTAVKIFLPNGAARDVETSKLYERLGCNKRQIEIIAAATPKKHYYYLSEKGRRLFDLALGPLALAFVGKTDKDSLALVKKLESAHGPAWVEEWLETNHISLAELAGAHA